MSTELFNLPGALKAFSQAHTTLWIVPTPEAADSDEERWGPVLAQVVSITERYAHGWSVDNDDMAQYRVKIPLAEIHAIEVIS